jgi:hypothetical protein
VHLIGFDPDSTPFVPLTDGHAAVVVSEAFAKFSKIFGKATGIACNIVTNKIKETKMLIARNRFNEFVVIPTHSRIIDKSTFGQISV